ncbi:MAG: discoidin domain-containing protein [Roseburia sp.]|nr:discoidin domain-containing protein [Roseburia sp.]
MKRNCYLKKSKRVLGIVMAAAIAITGIPFPATQVSASESAITVNGLTNNTLTVAADTNETISIGNDQLSRTFKIVNGKLTTGTIYNKLAGEDVVFTPAAGSEEFVIKTLGSEGQRQELETPLTSVRPVADTPTTPTISISTNMDGDGGGMDAATDKNASTWWSSQVRGVDQEYFQVLFGGEKKVTRVEYTPRWDNSAHWDCTGRITVMKFQVTYDGTTWTDLTDENGAVKTFDLGTDNTGEDYPVPVIVDLSGLNVVAKGIRVRAAASHHWQDSDKNKAMNIAEIDIFGYSSNVEGVAPASLIHVQDAATGWTLTGNSVHPTDGGGYAALLETDNVNTHYHSNYPNGVWPVELTLDRGTAITEDTAFQTIGYRPRTGGPNQNGQIKKFYLFASDSAEGLFAEENKVTFANGTKVGNVSMTGNFKQGNNNPEWVYMSLEEPCNARYIGIQVYASQNGNNFAAGSGLDLFKEEFESVPFYAGQDIKASELELVKVTSEVHVTNGGKEGNEGEKTGQLLTFEFKPITWSAQGTATIYQKVVMYEGDHYMRKWVEIKFSEDADKVNRIAYIDGEHLYTTPSTADLNAHKAANEEAGKDVIWTIPANSGGIVQMDEGKADLGQPVYINGLFMGSEFPAAQNKIELADATATTEAGTRLAISRYYTGKNLSDLERDDHFLNQLTDDNKFVSWQTVVGASRSDGKDQSIVQQDFFSYIRDISTPSDFRIQYNSWYDNMMRITDENIMEAFKDIDKNFVKTGVRPLDSYVVDDGWNVYRKTSSDLQGGTDIERNGKDDVNTAGFWQFNSKFPNELYTSSNYVQKMGSYFGVWIGPRGGYNYEGMLADIIQAGVDTNGDGVKDVQYGSKGGGSIDVADSRYVQKFAEMAVDWTNRFKVNYWKWDGFADGGQYGAFAKGSIETVGYSESNQHMYGGPNGEYHVTDLWEKWIYIMEEAREAAVANGIDNLWISLTCYTHPSAWFLQWANSVWIQCVMDRGESANSVLTDKLNTMLTYRDAVYHNFIVDHEYQFPLSNIYNHDPIYGKENTGIGADTMDGEQFRNHLFMQSGRGTAFWELYYSDSILNEEKYLINADYLEWAEANYELLKHAIMIGDSPDDQTTLTTGNNGNATQQSAYGFANFSETEADGILSMRNPAATDKTFTVTLDESIGVRFDEEYAMWKEHVYLQSEGQTAATHQVNGEEATNNILHKGDTITITLKPGEVQIWHLKKGGDTTAPALDKIYFNDANTIQVRASERLDNSDITFTVNGKAVPAENVTKYADLRTFIITLDEAMMDGNEIIVATANGTDKAGNALTGSISANYYADNTIVSTKYLMETKGTLSSADRSIVGDQGFSVSAEVVYGQSNIRLVRQGDEYALGINAKGQPYFTVNGITATSDVVMQEGKSYTLNGIRENNDYIRLYVNGQISAAAYDKSKLGFEVDAAPITFVTGSNTVKNIVVNSVAIAYDEVTPSALDELIKEIQTNKAFYTTESWTNAGMDAVLTAAQTAIALNQEDKKVEAYDNLLEAYAKLIPDTNPINYASGKIPTRGWVDGSAYDESYNSGRITYATNGTKTMGDYFIFGKDSGSKPAYMQIDLGEEVLLDSVKLWRYWDNGTYSSTAIVVSNDPNFANIENEDVLYYSHPSVQTEATAAGDDLFNLGVTPSNKLYPEESAGKVLYQLGAGETARKVRYVRVYGNGVSGREGSSENHIVEIEINGKPADPYNLNGLQEVVDRAEAEIATGAYTAASVAKLQGFVNIAKGYISSGVEEGTSVEAVQSVRNNIETAIKELMPINIVGPFNLTVKATSETEATLVFNAASGAETDVTYQVQILPEGTIEEISDCKYNLTELTAGTTYLVSVTATDSNGNTGKTVTKQYTHNYSNEVDEDLVGYSLSLEGTIGVNFYMDLSEEVLADDDAYMNFTLNGKSYSTVSVKEATAKVENDVTCYVFKCGVPVKDMETEITAQIILSNGKKGSLYTYKVEEYVDYVLANSEIYEKEIELVEAMNEFGDSAISYFAEESVEAIPELTETQFTELEKHQSKISNDNNNIYYGSSLLLKSDTVLRHYFTEKVTGSEKKGNLYYIETAGIPAHELGTDMELTVDGITITYNPLTYAYIALSRDDVDENLKSVMRAMYLYYEAAQEYANDTNN